MGGEKQFVLTAAVAAVGSPPRGRGKEIVDITEWPTNRITPAWAGKRNRRIVNRNRTKDHPRVGGEKLKICEKQD